jgi:hypothetical protein
MLLKRKVVSMKKLGLLIALIGFIDGYTVSHAQSVASPPANLNTVKYASSFPGATPDVKIANCIAALAPAGGTCHTDGVTGAFAATLVITQANVKLALGAGTLDFGSLSPGIQISADDVTIVGLGRGITTITKSVLYKPAIQVGTSSTVPGPKNFTLTGVSLVGPNPNYSGTVNTTVSGSTYTVAWVSGSNFAGLAAGGQINLGSTSPAWYTIASVISNTSLTLTTNPGTSTGIPYTVNWDVNGTAGLAFYGASNMHVFDNEFTGWGHCAVCLGEAYSRSNPYYAPSTQAIISGNSIHDNPGEGITIYVSNRNPALVMGCNLVTNNQIIHNGLSCYDTNSRFNTFSHSECSYNGWANKNGDTSNFQIHGSDNTVDTVTADFGNQWGVGVDGSNQTLINIHACGATSAFGSGYGIGIQLGNSGSQSSHITLKGGVVCNNPSHGIALAYLDRGIVEGVQVYGNRGNGIILYSNPSAPDTNNSVTDNIVYGNTAGAIADAGSNTLLDCNRTALNAPCSTNALVSQLSEGATSGTAPGCTSTGFSSMSTNCTVAEGGNDNLMSLSSLADGSGAATGTYVITFHHPLGAHSAICSPVVQGTSWNGGATFHFTGGSTTVVTISWDNNGVVPVKGSYYGINVGCWGT